MDIRERLSRFGKKTITLQELSSVLNIVLSDVKRLYIQIQELCEHEYIEPVKSSGKNGNISYPLYKKYRIMVKEETDQDTLDEIKRLHPLLLKSGYLSSNPLEFKRNRAVILAINTYLFSDRDEIFISRKERSFEIFRHEKILDDSQVKALLRKLLITEAELRFYDTPEYCFHDYIPIRKDHMKLLICENKDIWFNIRRKMFEDDIRSLFGVTLDGVVYGEGNKVSDRRGALEEYVKFMGIPDVKFLYWGDIDREGFDIFRRTRDSNENLEISLFIAGYRKMIERSRNMELEDSPSSKKQDMRFDGLLIDFSKEEQAFLKGVFENNKLIPQEIISYKFL